MKILLVYNYETASTTAETLTLIVRDALFLFGIDYRGQVYDGAASMSGELSGVQARITAHYLKAVYIHCFCHSLNLAVQDSSGKLPLIRKTLDTIQELSSH